MKFMKYVLFVLIALGLNSPCAHAMQKVRNFFSGGSTHAPASTPTESYQAVNQSAERKRTLETAQKGGAKGFMEFSGPEAQGGLKVLGTPAESKQQQSYFGRVQEKVGSSAPVQATKQFTGSLSHAYAEGGTASKFSTPAGRAGHAVGIKTEQAVSAGAYAAKQYGKAGAFVIDKAGGAAKFAAKKTDKYVINPVQTKLQTQLQKRADAKVRATQTVSQHLFSTNAKPKQQAKADKAYEKASKEQTSLGKGFTSYAKTVIKNRLEPVTSRATDLKRMATEKATRFQETATAQLAPHINKVLDLQHRASGKIGAFKTTAGEQIEQVKQSARSLLPPKPVQAPIEISAPTNVRKGQLPQKLRDELMIAEAARVQAKQDAGPAPVQPKASVTVSFEDRPKTVNLGQVPAAALTQQALGIEAPARPPRTKPVNPHAGQPLPAIPATQDAPQVSPTQAKPTSLVTHVPKDTPAVTPTAPDSPLTPAPMSPRTPKNNPPATAPSQPLQTENERNLALAKQEQVAHQEALAIAKKKYADAEKLAPRSAESNAAAKEAGILVEKTLASRKNVKALESQVQSETKAQQVSSTQAPKTAVTTPQQPQAALPAPLVQTPPPPPGPAPDLRPKSALIPPAPPAQSNASAPAVSATPAPAQPADSRSALLDQIRQGTALRPTQERPKSAPPQSTNPLFDSLAENIANRRRSMNYD
ncbi:hypothetical protein IPF37_06285 [bacterium]|nr:MAG: hypothetical protein IPF37_06285 [bacterium]